MARLVNDNKPNFVLNKIDCAVSLIGRSKMELKIACLGLAFKPDIDDLRESPALSIMRKISLMGFSEVLLAEPNIFTLPKEFKDKEQLVSLVLADEAIRAADIVVLLVDHTPFKSIDLGLLSGKQIIDTRGIWS